MNLRNPTGKCITKIIDLYCLFLHTTKILEYKYATVREKHKNRYSNIVSRRQSLEKQKTSIKNDNYVL
jgi:hypothetical protein